MRSAFRGPAHQLAVRMRINNCTHGHYGPSNQPCTSNCTSAEGLHFSAFHYKSNTKKTTLHNRLMELDHLAALETLCRVCGGRLERFKQSFQCSDKRSTERLASVDVCCSHTAKRRYVLLRDVSSPLEVLFSPNLHCHGAPSLSFFDAKRPLTSVSFTKAKR